MRLTRYTDYALRVLMHIAVHEGRLCSVSEIADTYNASRDHIKKVVYALARHGYVETVRGRKGGVRLAKSPKDITVGDVVRHTEDGVQLAECGTCLLSSSCGLKGVMATAAAAMLAVFDAYAISDLLTDRDTFLRLTIQSARTDEKERSPRRAEP